MITRNFNLNLYAGHSSPLVINANQYDQGEQWVFTLYNEDGTQYVPSTGAIVGIKSDGLGIINTGSVVDGKVVINETQQMTAAVGKATFELTIDSQTHGTANFVVLVEPKPGDNASLSESDLSLIQEALNATSPLPTGGTVGQVLTKTANGSAWSDAGTPTQEQVAEAVSDWADENITVTTGVVIDTSLAVAGAAADSKKVGDEISDLKSEIAQLEAIPRSVKLAMDTLFQNVAMKDDAVYSDEYATIHAWASAVKLLSISAVFDQGQNVIYETDSLDSLKQYLTVTASYDDGSSSAVSGYTLSGELTTGTSTITVLFDGKTATFDTTVTAVIYHLENRTFNNDDGINTHLKVLENDRNISMVFDADFAGQVSGSAVWKPFIVMNSNSPWEGVALQADGDSAKVIWMTKTASVPIARSYIGNAKIVITHAVGSGSMKYYYKVGSANMVSGTLTEAFSSITNTLRIGGAGATQPFNGTVNRFVVYDSVISTARINEFING